MHFRSTHRWLGRTAVIDAETVAVYVPAGRLWEHRRWRTVGGAELEDPLRDTSDDAPPIAHGQVAVLIEQLEAEDDEMDDDSDSEL